MFHGLRRVVVGLSVVGCGLAAALAVASSAGADPGNPAEPPSPRTCIVAPPLRTGPDLQVEAARPPFDFGIDERDLPQLPEGLGEQPCLPGLDYALSCERPTLSLKLYNPTNIPIVYKIWVGSAEPFSTVPVASHDTLIVPLDPNEGDKISVLVDQPGVKQASLFEYRALKNCPPPGPAPVPVPPIPSASPSPAPSESPAPPPVDESASPSPSTSSSESPAPGVGDNPGAPATPALPVTGSSSVLIVALAGLLLTAGAVLFVLARRRGRLVFRS